MPQNVALHHRSLLYVPAANPRAMAKISQLKADVLILDLEDSALPEAKDEARNRIRSVFVSDQAVQARLAVRVNASDTRFHAADLALLEQIRPEILVLPKVESAEQVRSFAAATAGEIWAMIETPLGLVNTQEIVTANHRVTALMLGLEDYAKEMKIRLAPDRSNVALVMQQVAIVAKAFGRMAFDGVYADVKDEAGFMADARQAKSYGYDGKSLIHPGTVEACHQAFGPSAEELAEAKATVAAFAQAKAEGKSIARIGGRMIEALHAAQAQAILDQAPNQGA